MHSRLLNSWTDYCISDLFCDFMGTKSTMRFSLSYAFLYDWWLVVAIQQNEKRRRKKEKKTSCTNILSKNVMLKRHVHLLLHYHFRDSSRKIRHLFIVEKSCKSLHLRSKNRLFYCSFEEFNQWILTSIIY